MKKRNKIVIVVLVILVLLSFGVRRIIYGPSVSLKEKAEVKNYVQSYLTKKYGKDNYFCHDNTSTDKEYDIALFVEPIICDQKDYVLDKWSSEKFLWNLYEER